MRSILSQMERRWGGLAATAMDRLRSGWWGLRGADMGAKVRVGSDCAIERPWCMVTAARVQIERGVHIKLVHDDARLTIGVETFIGFGTELDVALELSIGDHVLIAPGCFITDHHHRHAAVGTIASQGLDRRPVRIGNDVWLGAHAVVLAGITIGPGAIVGAGAVVTHDVAANSVVAGVPARPIGRRERSQ